MFLGVALNGIHATFIKIKAKHAFMVPTSIAENTVQLLSQKSQGTV
jgi:hypothetical protein